MEAHPRERKLSKQELTQDTLTNLEIDVQRIEQMLHTWTAVPNDDNAGQVPPVQALVKNGVTRWSRFARLTVDQVRTLSHATPHSKNPF
jgi:hypothetical protein